MQKTKHIHHVHVGMSEIVNSLFIDRQSCIWKLSRSLEVGMTNS
ncbi:hypothetical protein [Acetilactobacillus jinshanensis]|nr:hypothetical protein [Acetilactobacillus jinshanensis]